MGYLIIPTPRRLFDISGMIEDFARDFERKQEIQNSKCLRWSRITFGNQELKLQEICRLNVTWRILR